MSWKKELKKEEDEDVTEDMDVVEALDKLEALYYELNQLDGDGVLDSRVPDKIKDALSIVYRKV